jgi:hypothetical protein
MFRKKLFLVLLLTALLGTLFVGGSAVYAEAPRCFGSDGKTAAACDAKVQSDNGKLADNRCYKERRGGPNGVLQNYTEITCSDAKPTCYVADRSATNGCDLTKGSDTGYMRSGLCYLEVRDNSNRLQSYKNTPCFVTGDTKGGSQCGTGDGAEKISIDIGCRGNVCAKPTTASATICSTNVNAIVDAFFAIIRFLSFGVGIVIVASIVLAGIQYSSSRGDPAAVAKAIERVRNTVIGFVIYLLIYAILNWIVPAGVFS